MKRNPPGTVLLDDIKLEGGLVVRVSLDKKTGIFHARYSETFKMENGTHHDGESWSGKDLEKIREDVKRWAREKKALKWEPVIVVGPADAFGMHGGRKLLGHQFIREMRAKKLKGDGYEWRGWAHQKPDNGGFVYDEDLEVYPPSGTISAPAPWGGGAEPVVIEYTPDRWLALLQLAAMEAILKTRFSELVEGGEKQILGFLAKVPQVGLLGLSKEVK